MGLRGRGRAVKSFGEMDMCRCGWRRGRGWGGIGWDSGMGVDEDMKFFSDGSMIYEYETSSVSGLY